MNSNRSFYAVDSLLSQSLYFIINNLKFYLRDLENLKCLPPKAKDRILRKLTRTCYLYKSSSFKLNLSALVYDQLKHIDLVSVPLDDETLAILLPCTNLREIFLTGEETNVNITSEGLTKFFFNKTRAYLIRISNCAFVTDEVVRNISESCPNAAGIDLGGCQQITDESLRSLAQMEKLRWLTLSNTQITDDGVVALTEGKSAKNFEELRVNRCPNVTSRAFIAITNKCVSIQVLEFHNCNYSTPDESSSSAFNEGFKNLKQFTWTVTW